MARILTVSIISLAISLFSPHLMADDCKYEKTIQLALDLSGSDKKAGNPYSQALLESIRQRGGPAGADLSRLACQFAGFSVLPASPERRL